MWEDVLFPQFGGLAWLGIHAHMHFLSRNWLGSPDLALYTIVVIIAWQFVPFHTLIFQAGRRAIPSELYDAASVDGANMRQSFWHVTLPQLRYSIVTSSTLVLVGSLTYFDIIYILTQGGPGDTTRVLAMDMYNIGFNQTEFGYAERDSHRARLPRDRPGHRSRQVERVRLHGGNAGGHMVATATAKAPGRVPVPAAPPRRRRRPRCQDAGGYQGQVEDLSLRVLRPRDDLVGVRVGPHLLHGAHQLPVA